MFTLHRTIPQEVLTASIFCPASLEPHVLQSYYQAMGWQGEDLLHAFWSALPPAHVLLHRKSVHCPPPELARQTLIFFLETWVESPQDTGAIFFVPRVIPAFWHGLSRHVVELGLIPANELGPLPLLPIPVVVLTILSHSSFVHRRNRGRMDSNRGSWTERRTHQEAADAVRGLLPTPVTATY